MEVSDKELRKMLNAAWESGRLAGRHIRNSAHRNRLQYDDVSKILKEAKKKEEK